MRSNIVSGTRPRSCGVGDQQWHHSAAEEDQLGPEIITNGHGDGADHVGVVRHLRDETLAEVLFRELALPCPANANCVNESEQFVEVGVELCRKNGGRIERRARLTPDRTPRVGPYRWRLVGRLRGRADRQGGRPRPRHGSGAKRRPGDAGPVGACRPADDAAGAVGARGLASAAP